MQTIIFLLPLGNLGWDENNNRVIGANLNNGQIHVMDQNGAWIKSIGGIVLKQECKLLMKLKAVVTRFKSLHQE